MADVTKIKLPNGSEYDIKDSVSGYITAQTTLAGYGITDAKIENGSIILGSNSITPLTSFTETDPVFSVSAAYGISSTDITNWDKIYGLFTVTSGNSDGDYWWVLKIPQSGLYRYTNAPGSSGGLKEIYLPHSGSSRNTIIVNAAYTSSSNTLTLPNKTGTFALTSDIPTIPTNISAFTNDAGYITSYTETDPTVPSWAKAASKPTYTAAEVNAIPTSAKGAVNGVAELDSNGLIPTSQLPSYVDDVLEYSSMSSFPSTGETGKIYVDTSTNLTYRWSGSTYVEISPSLALGTTSSTAFRGDYGQSAYTHAVTNKGLAFASGFYKITTNSEGHVTAAVAVTASDIPDLSSIYSTTDEKVKAISDSGDGTQRFLVFGSNSGNAETKYYSNMFTLSHNTSTQTAVLIIGSSGTTQTSGKLYLYNGTANSGTFTNLSSSATSMRSIIFPDNSGTVALTTDIPTVPTNVSSFINDAGYVASTTTAHLTVSDTAPSNPSIGDIWVDTSSL